MHKKQQQKDTKWLQCKVTWCLVHWPPHTTINSTHFSSDSEDRHSHVVSNQEFEDNLSVKAHTAKHWLFVQEEFSKNTLH